MPGAEEREQIWELQVHPKKTPLAPDVDFRKLAERYVLSGGDIKNAVIKAAAAAAAEPGPDLGKRISQRHFECATEEVLSAKSIMQQSLFAENGVAAPDPVNVLRTLEARWRTGMLVALGLAGAALITALVAVGLVLLR
jgi:SpoVK/Ycf46/Vps4 family AAA+-type ATPase